MQKCMFFCVWGENHIYYRILANIYHIIPIKCHINSVLLYFYWVYNLSVKQILIYERAGS
jgi:hypothetical protein